jgi:hypothetical protein
MASTVTAVSMGTGLIAIGLRAGIIGAQGQDLESNVLVAAAAATIALIALGWGVVSL